MVQWLLWPTVAPRLVGCGFRPHWLILKTVKDPMIPGCSTGAAHTTNFTSLGTLPFQTGALRLNKQNQLMVY